jgi:hypothetical protein
MLRVAAVVEDVKLCLLAGDDGDQHLAGMALTEVSTKTALTCMNSLHKTLLNTL